jgi:hypothetical protein
MKWHEKIIKAHLQVTDAVSHSRRLNSTRYFVWQEDGSNDLMLGDRHAERAVAGTTDLFTTTEFDPWADEIVEAFSSFGIAWSLAAVQYEEDTGFYHYTWDWEVV